MISPPTSHLPLLLALLALSAPALAQTQKPLNDTITVDKRQFSLFHPTPRKLMRPMVPDRPGITESPYSVDAGHFQYETDALRLLTRRDGTTYGHDWYGNHFLAKIGLTDKTDLQLALDSFTDTRNFDEADPSATVVARGVGDVTLRVKHTLVGDDNSRWALGLIGYVQLPTGGFVGDGGYEPGLTMPVVYQVTKDFSVGGQLAVTRYFDRDTNRHFTQYTPTLTTDYQFNKLLQAFVELVGYRDVRQPGWYSSVNTGLQFDVSDNVQLDCGTHLPVTRSVDREYFVGLSFRR